MKSLYARRFAAAAALTGSLAALVLPMYSGNSYSTPTSEAVMHEKLSGWLLDLNGQATALVVLSIPVVVALVPLILPRVHRAAGVILLLFSLAGAMTVGLFYRGTCKIRED